MKNKLIIAAIFVLFLVNKNPVSGQSSEGYEDVCQIGEKVDNLPFYVYKDAGSPENHFAPTGHMGDYADLNTDQYYKTEAYSGATCIKISYNPGKESKNKWAGFYWQDPPNNWGESFGGYDLSESERLTFWAKGEKGGEVITLFQVGGIVGKYRDSGSKAVGPITLTNKWKKYTIDLSDMKQTMILNCKQIGCCLFMQPLSRIIGGFCWSTSTTVNHGKAVIFYLDEIRYEKD